jgi:type II secretory pathway pseudopilin PulG
MGKRGVMVKNMMRKRNKQGGFSFVELVIALLIIIVLVAVVILVSRGFFSKARESALDVDLHTVQTAVDTYAIQSGKWPTANRALPVTGQYAMIDFNASFDKEGKIFSCYPHFISKLPRHWDDEPKVWRIDSAGLVSVDMPRDKY